MKLYKALKIGYMNKDKQESKMGKRGYVRDNELSSGDHQAYFNKKTGKLLFNVTGTHNLSDVVTDGYLAFGGLKSTNRYKEADKMLSKAKEKYKPTSTSVIGHSLGSSIAQNIGSKEDKITTLDGGYTIGQKTRSNNGNNKTYRTAGDAVSLLAANATNMTTLKNNQNHKGLITGALTGGIGGAIYGGIKDVLHAHDIDNIKNEKIFI
jgi:hypothetical protein